MRTSTLYLSIYIALLVLSSCSIPTKECVRTPSPELLHEVAQTSTWHMHGRFSAVHNNQAFSGGYTWQQHADHFSITVTGPLGVPVAYIQGNDTSAAITGANQTQPQALNTFLHDELGFDGDITLLRSILLGTNKPYTDDASLQIQQQYNCITVLPVPEKVILRWHNRDHLTVKTQRWETTGSQTQALAHP